MITYKYDDKYGGARELRNTGEYIVLRAQNKNARFLPQMLSKKGQEVLAKLQPVFSLPDVGVEVRRQDTIPADEALFELKKEVRENLRFAGRALAHPAYGAPVVYTENLFIKLEEDCRSTIGDIVKRADLVPKNAPRDIGSGGKTSKLAPKNAYFVKAPESTGQNLFEIADRLLRFPEVRCCYPEIIRPSNAKRAFSGQWHLGPTTIAGVDPKAHVSAEEAWNLLAKYGKDARPTIAIIDDGVDVGHPEFESKEIVAQYDFIQKTADANPKMPEDAHGTPCAGVACGSGENGASGVAPNAKLMPIRAPSREVGSILQSDAICWAVDKGADVISCSWGPPDGPVGVTADPRRNEVHALPEDVRLALEYAVTAGRDGRGCLVTFAAGNGNESVDNDMYASYDKVVAVAACNDQAKRCFYSDYGKAIWCAFPSGDAWYGRTTGIWTTDRRGADGLNIGIDAEGDWEGNFTNSFGGTSAACAGAAGVAALIISACPALRWDEVRDIMRDCCDRIDITGGFYDAGGHSPYYGYGRLNAAKAVELALARCVK